MTGNKVLWNDKDDPRNITLFAKTGRPNIYYYFRHNGKTYRGTTGCKIDELRRAREVIGHIYEQVLSGQLKRKKDIITFGYVAEEFLKDRQQKVLNKRLSQKTLDEYTRQVGYLLELFGKREIEKFGKEDIHKEYIDWRRNYYDNTNTSSIQTYTRAGKNITGRRLKRNVGSVSIDKECQLLVSILNYGRRFLNVLQNTYIAPYEKQGKANTREILSKEEYLKLKKYWTKKNPYYWQIMSFLNNTGLRFPSEIFRLKWGDIDLPHNRMTIRERKRKGDHTIPLVSRAKEIIETLYMREGIPNGKDDYVWLNDNGERITNISKAFKKSLVVCGINKNISMYSFRHLYTTRMVKRPDIPLKIISEILGHTTLAMIEKHYAKLRIDDFILSVENSEKHREALIQQETQLQQMEDQMKKLNGEEED